MAAQIKCDCMARYWFFSFKYKDQRKYIYLWLSYQILILLPFLHVSLVTVNYFKKLQLSYPVVSSSSSNCIFITRLYPHHHSQFLTMKKSYLQAVINCSVPRLEWGLQVSKTINLIPSKGGENTCTQLSGLFNKRKVLLNVCANWP